MWLFVKKIKSIFHAHWRLNRNLFHVIKPKMWKSNKFIKYKRFRAPSPFNAKQNEHDDDNDKNSNGAQKIHYRCNCSCSCSCSFNGTRARIRVDTDAVNTSSFWLLLFPHALQLYTQIYCTLVNFNHILMHVCSYKIYNMYFTTTFSAFFHSLHLFFFSSLVCLLSLCLSFSTRYGYSSYSWLFVCCHPTYHLLHFTTLNANN